MPPYSWLKPYLQLYHCSVSSSSQSWPFPSLTESESEVAQLCPTLCNPMAYRIPPSIGFSRQEYWSGLPFPSPEDLPDPGIRPRDPTQVSRIVGRRFTVWATREALTVVKSNCTQISTSASVSWRTQQRQRCEDHTPYSLYFSFTYSLRNTVTSWHSHHKFQEVGCYCHSHFVNDKTHFWRNCISNFPSTQETVLIYSPSHFRKIVKWPRLRIVR